MAEKLSVGASDTSDETSIDTAEKGGDGPRRRGMRVNFKVQSLDPLADRSPATARD